jgi:hypothetical protein
MNALTQKLNPLHGVLINLVHQEYGELMQKVRKEAPSAVLVGGAVRDTIFRRAVKDLDFMVLSDADVSGIERALGITVRDVLGFDRLQGRSEYDEDANVYRVFETEDKRINILHVGSIVTRVVTFPDSISQVIYDGSFVRASQYFEHTFATMQITHSHEPLRVLKPERRERLASKYPDFTFKDCN